MPFVESRPNSRTISRENLVPMDIKPRNSSGGQVSQSFTKGKRIGWHSSAPSPRSACALTINKGYSSDVIGNKRLRSEGSERNRGSGIHDQLYSDYACKSTDI